MLLVTFADMFIADHKDTIVALSTAPGVGAIAVIRMSGDQAIAIIAGVFKGKDLLHAEANTLHFGRIEEGATIVDEVVVGVFRSPRSYTGEDIVEVSCHGSPYIQQQILTLLVAQGARMAKPGEFTMRAFLNGKMDLTQAEAVADLIAAQSQASHDVAMKQMRSGYGDALKNLRYELIHFASLIELELDFSEEDVEFAERSHLMHLINKICSELDRLIKSFSLGNVIRNGVETVIAGRPNAGKSTLLNALLNEDRAIVSDIAGTTRDTIEAELNIKGVRFRLIDTAGIREAKDEIEKIGVAKTLEKIKTATLLIYVFDVHSMTPEEVRADLDSLVSSGDNMLVIANKIDALGGEERAALFTKVNPDGFISSLQKVNIERLKEAMFARIVHEDITLEDAVVTNARHLEALRKARTTMAEVQDALAHKTSGELTALSIRYALNAIGEITGEVTNEDLLDNIFRKFCIGK